MQCTRRRPRPSYDQNQALRELQDSETWPLCEPKGVNKQMLAKAEWPSSLIVVSGCRRKARLYMGRVESGLFKASSNLKRKERVVSEVLTVLDAPSTLVFS
jgi:hypothetical protein